MSSPSVRALTAAQLVSNAGRVSDLLRAVVPASRLERPAPPTVSTGIAALDGLTGGLPRGALTEIFGPASSGRSSLMLSLLAEMTARQEVCALVDASDCFDPESAAAAGVNLGRVLWVRCGNPFRRGLTPINAERKKEVVSGQWAVVSEASEERSVAAPSEIRKSSYRVIGPSRHRVIEPLPQDQSEIRNRKSEIRNVWWRLEQALKAADLLLQAGGFGLVVVDLGDVPPAAARRVPLTSWFRFRRAVEHTPTVLVAIAQEPCAKTCASLVLKLQAAVSHNESGDRAIEPSGDCTHVCLLRGLTITAEVVRSRMEQKKPNHRVTAQFESKTAWNF